jgi:hypothetical protein
MRALCLMLCVSFAVFAQQPAERQQRRKQVRERAAEEQQRALHEHDEEDEASFEADVRAHPDDEKLQAQWRIREVREKQERQQRAMSRASTALDPRTPAERGENAVVRVTWAGAAGDESCSGVLVGATASTALVLTRARCVADLSTKAAPKPRQLKVEFLLQGSPPVTAGVLVQKIYPGYLEALAKGTEPHDGSDLALVITSAPVPPAFTLLLILQEPAAALRALVKKPLQVVGFGKPGGGRRNLAAGREADVEKSCGSKACEGRTNALLLSPADAREGCGDADAGGAVTILYPPSVFLVAINDGKQGKRGACWSHPLSDLGSAPLAWVAKNAVSNDFKTCIRDPRTARVTCRDSRAMAQQ